MATYVTVVLLQRFQGETGAWAAFFETYANLVL